MPALHSQHATKVGATSRWLFGTDSLLQIKWKIPNSGYVIASWSDDYFLAAKYSRDSTHILVASVPTGSRFWTKDLPGIPRSWGIFRDSAFGLCLLLKSEAEDSTTVEYLDLVTGKLASHHTTARPKANVISRGSCPLPSPSDTLALFSTSRYLCSISPDLKIIWKTRFGPRERLAATDMKCGIIRGPRSIRVVDKKTGRIWWKREFPDDIAQLISGRHVTVKLRNGIFEQIDLRTGRTVKQTGN
jgi:hypothetical protein